MNLQTRINHFFPDYPSNPENPDPKWIWSKDSVNEKNIYVRFKRTFEAEPHATSFLRITASARYSAYLNGIWLGQGPPRAWPEHYEFDVYDITSPLRSGKNTLAVLVHYFGTGNMQWIPTAPGLIAELEISQPGEVAVIGTDRNWRASRDPCFIQRTPRMCIQMGFEEQFDARKSSHDWRDADFDDTNWPEAIVVGEAEDGPVKNLSQRTIPYLTARTIHPAKLVTAESVRSNRKIWSIDLRSYFNPEDKSADFMVTSGFLFTRIHTAKATEVLFTRLQARESRIKFNGQDVPSNESEGNYFFPVFNHKLHLQPGWNSLIIDFRQREHLTRMVCAISSKLRIDFAWNGAAGAAWALLGPFENPESQSRRLDRFPFSNVATTTLQPGASLKLAEELWEAGGFDRLEIPKSLIVEIKDEDIAEDNVFARAITDEITDSQIKIPDSEHLITGKDGWATVSHSYIDCDTRLLFDFGREIVGQITWEIDAPEGTVVDFVGFENMKDKRTPDWTEGVNNSLRYICREGQQVYRSFWRRGLRYLYVIARETPNPVKLRRVAVIENIYPQAKHGDFRCSDSRLDQIWKTGAHTMACCSEDTYVDCPAYEQVHWVGDARNEALVDWIVNGDARLWKHCLLQAGFSLERSPLVESHVPSAWPIILPAWSFLWMRSCYEYYLFTGDREGAETLWPWIRRNIDGVKRYLNRDSLFEIRAWNMFDWAEMDTPDEGVVTHQNCLLVLALNETARLARWLDRHNEAEDCSRIADELTDAINLILYDSRRNAYVDARHSNGKISEILSQQTQTVALASGVAKGERAKKARKDMRDPPGEYVSAGSPFFMFFLLEALMNDEDASAVVDEIREKWGFMIDQGATTFWEMWSGKKGRLTRSHCHGWSAAPTFFLSTFILGVMPLEPGFTRTRISPHPGLLRWAKGIVPTPFGNITASWKNPEEGPFDMQVQTPEKIQLEIVKPKENASIVVSEV